MIVEADRAAGEFRKRAETSEEAVRLGHEARVLEVARHPGVVHLLRTGASELTLALVDGEALSPATGDMSRIAVMLTTTLADLHDIGVVHRDIRADHILIDRTGQPVLCGFGHAALDADPGAADADVAALAKTLLAVTMPDDAMHRGLSEAATGRHPPSARRLAAILATTPTPRRPRPAVAPVAAVAAAAAVVVAVAVGMALVANGEHGSGRGGPATAPTSACPEVDRGCRPLPRPTGLIDTPMGRFRIGHPDDLLVLGRWRCATALPALLRPATGEVWVWDSWAQPSAPVKARLVGRIADAASVRVDPGPSGCDLLEVVRLDGGGVVIYPDRPA